MRTDVVTYFNGKRYMRRTRRAFFRKTSTIIVFAYRGVPAEWPTVISYVIR